MKHSPSVAKICLIHGPPGTGKSKTIVGLLYRLLTEVGVALLAWTWFHLTHIKRCTFALYLHVYLKRFITTIVCNFMCMGIWLTCISMYYLKRIEKDKISLELELQTVVSHDMCAGK